MTFLTEQEKQNIREAIREAEAQTSGEIVTVIARSADEYLYIPTLWAGLLALLTPSVLLWLPQPLDYIYMYAIQVVVFFVCAILFRWTPIKMKLVPRAVKQRRANRLANLLFLQHGVHQTEQRNGLLLFVSVAERYVEIMADKGINDRVPQDTWRHIVDEFVNHVKQGQIAKGFAEAVDQSGALLKEHFPIEAGDKNELPNHLIEI